MTSSAAPSQTVLDLGAGARLDALVTRRIVSDTGRALGADFTPGELPAAVRASAELYAGCVAGALDEAHSLGLSRAAGLEDVAVVKAHAISLPVGPLPVGTALPLWSVTLRGRRPATTPSTQATGRQHAAPRPSCRGGGHATIC